jgi:hypothetical protein
MEREQRIAAYAAMVSQGIEIPETNIGLEPIPDIRLNPSARQLSQAIRKVKPVSKIDDGGAIRLKYWR